MIRAGLEKSYRYSLRSTKQMTLIFAKESLCILSPFLRRSTIHRVVIWKPIWKFSASFCNTGPVDALLSLRQPPGLATRNWHRKIVPWCFAVLASWLALILFNVWCTSPFIQCEVTRRIVNYALWKQRCSPGVAIVEFLRPRPFLRVRVSQQYPDNDNRLEHTKEIYSLKNDTYLLLGHCRIRWWRTGREKVRPIQAWHSD
jgi:hypothetical protein